MMITKISNGTTYRYITSPSELVGRIMSDYYKGRSICPERWNDPLDYEEDCEDYYVIADVIPDAIGKGYVINGHMMSTYDDVDVENNFPCYYIPSNEMVKLCHRKFFCLGYRYNNSGEVDKSKMIRIDLFYGTAQEFIDIYESED